MLEDVDLMTPQLDYVEALLDGFNLTADSSLTSGLADDFENVKDRYEGLQRDLSTLLVELEAGGEIVSEFQVYLLSYTLGYFVSTVFLYKRLNN